jgi:hypothetical protein
MDRALNKPQHNDEEITEQMVEGIYAESQYKIENLPGYAEAYKRAYACFKKFMEDGYEPNKHDQEKLDQALGEMMILEFLHRPK